MNMFSTKNRLNQKLALLAGRLLPGLGLVLLFLLLPTAASAQFTCPSQDNAGFALGQSNLTTNPIFCSYPAIQGENPNDFFCTYSQTTGNLVQDHDAGFCPAKAVSTAATPPTVSKTFSSGTVVVGATVTMTIVINSPASNSSTGLTFTDTLPSGVVVAATPNAINNGCGGTFAATAGASSVTLTGGTLAAGASCNVKVDIADNNVSGTMSQNCVTVGSANGNSNQSCATVTTVTTQVLAPTLTKTFGASIIGVGSSTTLTFTLTNPAGNSTSLTNLSFTDTLPSGLLVSTPNGLVGSCGGGTITAVAASNSISLSGATLAAGASCNFGVNITGIAAGKETNTTSSVTDAQGVTGAPATATVTVAVPPTISKSFAASQLEFPGPDDTTALSFTITNPNAVALSGITFFDVLPSGLIISTPNGLAGSCGGGTITAPAGSNTLSLAGATLTANASCTFSVNVTATQIGVQVNTTSAITAMGGTVVGNPATASVSVIDLFFQWFFSDGGGGQP
jgi:uncharacterized repeat protein (TIGR01451 family)